MTDDVPTFAPRSVRVEVTTAFLAETKAKQAAYAARRRRHTDGYHEPDAGTAETWSEVLGQPDAGAAATAVRSVPRGQIHDRKQRTLALV